MIYIYIYIYNEAYLRRAHRRPFIPVFWKN